MTMYRIETGGKAYRVDAASPEAAAAAVEEMVKSAAPPVDPSKTVAGTVKTAEGGERGSIVDPVLQGLTIGGSDELFGVAGGVGSVLGGGSFAEGYDKAAEDARADLDAYRQRNPVISTIAEIGGSIPTALIPVGGAVRAATLGKRMLQGAGAGAVLGGTYGGLSSEGDLVDRGIGAAGGAVTGGLIGGAFPAATAGIGAAVRPVVDAVGSRINPTGFAARKVVERLGNAGRGIDSVARRIERAAAGGQNLSLADAGGRGVQTLARTVANTPGPGADRVAAKINLSAMSQGDRIKSIVGNVFGAPGEGYQTAKNALMAARSSAAKPFYNAAYKSPVPYTFELESMLNTPAGRAGLAAAKRNSANRREPWAQWFANVADDGSIIDAHRVPDTRALDEVKRVLDAMVEAAKRPADGSPFAKAMATPESIAIQSVRDDLVGFLKTNNPAYAKALEVSGANIRADEALEFGRNALSTDSRVIAKKLGMAPAGREKPFTEAEKEFARVGLAEAIRERVDKAGLTHNALLKFFSTREQAAQIRPFFRDAGERQAFTASILNEARKRKTVDAVRSNSTTARQLLDAQDAGRTAETVGVMAQAATGGLLPAAISALQNGLRRMGGLTPKVANEMARLIMSTDPGSVRSILIKIREIETAQLSAADRAARLRSLLSNFAAGQSGNAVGSQQSPLPAAR